MYLCKFAIVSVCAVLVAQALPTKEEPRSNSNEIRTEHDLIKGVYTDCLHKDHMACLKYKLLIFVNNLLGKEDIIKVTEGVQVVKSDSVTDSAPRFLNNNESIEDLILHQIQRFIESHTIKIDLKGNEIVSAVSSTARSLTGTYDNFLEEENEVDTEEGRDKKGKKMLLAAAAMQAAVMAKLALAGLALFASKALLVGKIALVLSIIIGLNSLLGQRQQHTSHGSSSEIASSPPGHGGWKRSLDAQKLAYGAQIPADAKL